MKAPSFDYARPETLAEASSLLEQYPQGQAMLMAGGQTLLATLNMRLSEPGLIIDLCDVPGMRGISMQSDHIRIGALSTHSSIEDSALIRRHLPLLAEAAPHIAHRSIRNRGTMGGSIAYADPAAEWPACALALDATIVAQSANRTRHIKASDFFLDLYTTALEPAEIITAILYPLPHPLQVHFFSELVRRHGDYAIVGLAASAQRQPDGSLTNLRLAFPGVSATPWLATKTALALEGISAGSLLEKQQEASIALANELIPIDDIYHTPETKRYLAQTLLERALHALTVPKQETLS